MIVLTLDDPIIIAAGSLSDLYRVYLVTGGMPQVILEYYLNLEGKQ
jgi:hypothetical protein